MIAPWVGLLIFRRSRNRFLTRSSDSLTGGGGTNVSLEGCAPDFDAGGGCRGNEPDATADEDVSAQIERDADDEIAVP